MIKPGDIVIHDWWARGNMGHWDRPGLVIDVYDIKQLDYFTKTEFTAIEARVEWFSVRPFRNGDITWGRYNVEDLGLYCSGFQKAPVVPEWL